MASAEAVVQKGTRGMADPGGAVEVHGAVALNGAVPKKDPEALLAQIEQTRQELASTIDSLAERVSPAHNARLLRERINEQIARPEVQIAAVAVGLAVVGLTILRIWSRRRR